MNLSFRFVLEKSVLHFIRAAGHAPNVDPTGNRRRSTRPVSISAVAALSSNTARPIGPGAAFDRVDYGLLLQRLQFSFGVTCVALQWINSFHD